MPRSADDRGQRLAVAAECLYLVNLTFLPVMAFVVLLWLYSTRTADTPSLALCHMRQALFGSLWAGVLLVLLNVVILLLGGYRSSHTLIALILYFFSAHSALIVLGMVGLSKALAGKPFVYPLIGVRCD